ncbi:hypothetical protein [Kushneria indalinina]|uniref:Helix-turn-helix protein n=1 Tax=Kushneria indalinina DSM 14324 TaxID=1122140 RepID=A0A3D9DW70_9GAMM|nr:hypothetical protein [Kushneria indalinina]REC94895.1 hypothetical protein C8D72_1724 [Kushneria indalinina DSM 14324]
MIDARTQYAPETAARLIDKAVAACTPSTRNELAERIGMTRQYLSGVYAGRKTMSYGMQVMLESITAP